LVICALGCAREGSTVAGEPEPRVIVRPAVADSTPALFRGHEGALPVGAERYLDVLPAYRLPTERRAGKADQFDDFRLDHPEWYAITVPPSEVRSEMRPMVEWEPMQALLMTVAATGLPPEVDQNIAEMAHAAVRTAGVDVYLVYSHAAHRQTVATRIADLGLLEEEQERVSWLRMSNDSVWAVDYGPFSVRDGDGNLAFVDFRYYHQRVHDDSLTPRLAKDVFDVSAFRMPVDFEGGNLQADSMGTCYTSRGLVWFNKTPRAELEELFERYLGCRRLVLLEPLKDEGTAHIDMFFKLVDDHTALLGSYTEEQDPENMEVLDDNEAILESIVLEDGRALRIIRFPMPDNDEHTVWRTYLNSTLVKGPRGAVNLWPTYEGQPELQREALAIWQSVLPGWTHQGVPSDVLISWGGAMHCISRAVPTGKLNRWVRGGLCAGGSCLALSEHAYDGSCVDANDCRQLRWVCGTNDCSGASACNGVAFEGCCEGGSVVYCESGSLRVSECNGSPCGWSVEKRLYDCGARGAAPPAFPTACPGACVPRCDGLDCGPDGCGGTCGVCGEGEVCSEGACLPADGGCGSVGSQGRCVGDTLLLCSAGGELSQTRCAECCGWSSKVASFDCLAGRGCTVCRRRCERRTCGSDGCGGHCGSCAPSEICDDGVCVVAPPAGNPGSGGAAPNPLEGGLGGPFAGSDPSADPLQPVEPNAAVGRLPELGGRPAGGCSAPPGRAGDGAPLAACTAAFGLLVFGLRRRRRC